MLSCGHSMSGGADLLKKVEEMKRKFASMSGAPSGTAQPGEDANMAMIKLLLQDTQDKASAAAAAAAESASAKEKEGKKNKKDKKKKKAKKQ